MRLLYADDIGIIPADDDVLDIPDYSLHQIPNFFRNDTNSIVPSNAVAVIEAEEGHLKESLEEFISSIHGKKELEQAKVWLADIISRVNIELKKGKEEDLVNLDQEKEDDTVQHLGALFDDLYNATEFPGVIPLDSPQTQSEQPLNSGELEGGCPLDSPQTQPELPTNSGKLEGECPPDSTHTQPKQPSNKTARNRTARNRTREENNPEYEEDFNLDQNKEDDLNNFLQKKEEELFETVLLAHNSKTEVRRCVKVLYSQIQRFCKIGGNGSGGAIYGEMRLGSFQKIVDYMKKYLDFSKESKFLDIGSGVGKPTLHVSQDPGVSLSMGIELKKERCYLSQHVLRSLLLNSEKKNLHIKNLSKCWFLQGDITFVNSLSPFTHVYSFDIGWKSAEYELLAILFNASTTCMYYICYKTPQEMKEFGFKVELLHKMTDMKQHGSGSAGYPCYFYKKKVSKGRKRKGRKRSVSIDGINRFEESEAFLHSSSLATKIDNLYEYIEEANTEMVTPRKKRNATCCKCFIPRDTCPCPLY